MYTVLYACSCIFYRVLQECTDVTWKLLGYASLGPYGPYGPVQINPICHSHFDIGYTNLR
jgi:hypothetical protein